MTLFDAYVAVDWSARSSPATGVDSVWIGVAAAEGTPVLVNPSTRAVADTILRSIIAEHRQRRVLVGFDAALGYPRGTADAFGIEGDPPWLAVWRTIASSSTDDARNRNNRFDVAADLNRAARATCAAGPFWGHPRSWSGEHLASTKPADGVLAEYRSTEATLRSAGHRPSSVWQLLGAGSVGGQTLTLLPILWRWWHDFGGRLAIWPFTTGLVPPRAADGDVVVAEVWPSRFTDRMTSGRVRDAEQVAATALALRNADADGKLSGWFEPSVPDATRAWAAREEGWILGPP